MELTINDRSHDRVHTVDSEVTLCISPRDAETEIQQVDSRNGSRCSARYKSSAYSPRDILSFKVILESYSDSLQPHHPHIMSSDKRRLAVNAVIPSTGNSYKVMNIGYQRFLDNSYGRMNAGNHIGVYSETSRPWQNVCYCCFYMVLCL